jgi:alpha-1,2-mannosyltransferase
VRHLGPRASTSGNTLIYILWAAGLLGTLATNSNLRPISIVNRDFTSFWIAGKLAASGHAAQAYDPVALKAAAHAQIGTTFSIAYPYPPHFFFLTVPLSWLPLGIAYITWIFISGALFYVAAKPYLPRGFPSLLVLLTPAAFWNATFGQTGFLYGAFWLFAFRGSPVAAALLTVKPNLGILVAVDQTKRRQLLRTTMIALLLIIVSAAVFGVDAWRACVTGLTTNHLKWVQSGKYGVWFFQMASPYLAYGLIGWLGFAVAALFLLTRRFDAFTAATAAFLVSPYGFHYDMTVICLAFGIVLFQSWRSMPPWHTLVCALAFLSPAIVRAGTWLVPPILVAGLYVLTSSAIDAPEEGHEDDVRSRQDVAGDHRVSATYSVT